MDDNEDANENINHVNRVEGLMSEAWKHLNDLVPNFPRQTVAKAQAIEEVDLFIKTTLSDLRIVFEGD